MIAAFATLPEESRGRRHSEEESTHRSAFQRDRDRIIHSSAFRRLKHKTQVFVEHEGHYADFDGLNLTWETLEGIAKHNGPVTGEVPFALAEYDAEHDLELDTHASAEAQVAAIADDIA